MAKRENDHSGLISEAKDRFRRCMDFEEEGRKRFLDDVKFANGDPDNGYQWPDALRKSRDFDAKPCLTINKTFQHNLLIINDIAQNMPTSDVHPVGDDGDYQAAQVFEDVIRHIEYQSNAKAAYQTAVEHQVSGGVGYWRYRTRYASEDSFNQDIFIERIKDALQVAIDPDCKEFDCSDAEYGFVFAHFSHEQFKAKYPKWVGVLGTEGVGEGDDWMTPDSIRLCEYYRKEYVEDELWAIPDEQTGEVQTIKMSEVPEKLRAKAMARPGFRSRKIKDPKVMWYLLAGQQVIDSTEIPCTYIPIVRIVGWETVIDGKVDRKGHTRQLKDPQRMYNYWASSAVEHVVLQSKTPYVGDLRSFEGLEKYWENANKENFAYLPYNGVGDDGQPIPAPQRQQPPVMASGYIQGLENAANEMAMVSGQYQNQFGAPGPEEAGVAIQARRRQGGVSTFHFSDHFAAGIRFGTKILLDMIPRVYDTARVIEVMSEDGQRSSVQVNPVAPQAFQKKQTGSDTAQIIFNPKVGKYGVVAEAGPNYQTRREEAFAAMSSIIGQSPELMKVAGDLLFKSADFPMADEIAQRLARTIPDPIRTGVPNPQVAQLQQQVQQLEQLLQTAKNALKEKADRTSVEDYRAQTDRLHTLIDHPQMDPREIRLLIQQEVAKLSNGLLPLPPVAPQMGPSPPAGGAASPSPAPGTPLPGAGAGPTPAGPAGAPNPQGAP